MTLWQLLSENLTTVIAYSIFFAILALTLPFIGYLGRKFPTGSEKRNLLLAKILAIVAIFGIILTVGVSFLFVYIRLRDLISFEFFAVVNFIFPLILGPLVSLPFYLTKQSDGVLNLFKMEGRTIDNHNGAEIFIVYAAFGIVASNFHDILWCGEKTSWFTVTGHLGYELEIWVDVVGANTYDYVFFGFFMLLHVIFCGAIATFLLWRYTHRYGESLIRNPHSRQAFILAWFGALLWGYGLYIMDKSSIYFVNRQPTIAWIVGTFVWIPLGIFLLGFSARYLSIFEQKS